jgi:hypothetical protein
MIESGLKVFSITPGAARLAATRFPQAAARKS